MVSNRTKRVIVYGVLGAATGMVGQAAFAQTAASTVQTETDSRASDDASGDIIVSAQRREQSLQDVPITVNVVTAEQLDRYSISDIRAAVTRVPGLEIRNSAEQDSITLRGLGNFGSTNFGFDSPIGIFIDGVYHGRINQTRLAFMDVERLEVLKGPQSILFGMNTPIGAISIISAKPTNTLEGYVQATGNFKYDNYELRGALNVPLSDTFAIRVAALKTFEEGYYRNTLLNQDEGGTDIFGWRATARWAPDDRLTVIAKVQGGTVRRAGTALFALTPPTSAADIARAKAVFPGVNFDAKDLIVTHNNGFRRSKSFEPVLTVDYDLGPATLQSISAYSYYRGLFANQLAAWPISFGQTLGDEKARQYSQELRLSSNGDNAINYQAGVFWQRGTVYNQRPLDFILGAYLPSFATSPSGALQTYIGNFRQTYTTYAAFGQLSVEVLPKFTVTGGLRVSHDRKVASSIFDWIVPGSRSEADILTPGTPAFTAADFTFNTIFGINRHRSSGKYSKTFAIPDVKAQWEPSDAVTLYASVGQGRLAGGFNDRDNKGFNFSFGPEEAVNYEAGAKFNVIDRRLQFNVSAFRTDFTDLQVSTFDLTTNDFIVSNAAEAISEGIDMDFRFRVVPGVSLTGGLTKLFRNRYGTFIAPCRPTAANAATCTPTPGVAGTGTQNRSNEELGNSKFSAVAGIDFTSKVSQDFTLDGRFDFRHQSGKPISAINPAKAIEPATFLDARMGVTYRDGLSAAIVVQNLTDNRHIDQTGTFLVTGMVIGTVSPPRTVALQLGYKF